MSKNLEIAAPYLQLLCDQFLPLKLYKAIITHSPSMIIKALTEIFYNIVRGNLPILFNLNAKQLKKRKKQLDHLVKKSDSIKKK